MTYLKTLAVLFYEFFVTGVFAVGGGLTTLPFLMRMSQSHPDWFSTEDLTNMIAVSESTPGPIGINMSTYVGFKVAGIPGVMATAVGIVLPSAIIILIISRFLEKYMSNNYVKSVFSCLRPAVTGLIAAAGWLVVRETLFLYMPQSLSAVSGSFNISAVLLFAAIVILTRFNRLGKLHPVVYIAASAAAGIILKL